MSEVVPTSDENYKIRKQLEWCSDKIDWHLEGLDDRYCQKIFPKYFDREFSCPIYYDQSSLAGFANPGRNVSEIEFDEQELRDILPDDLNVVIAIIRRY